jgi:hypothetical protein
MSKLEAGDRVEHATAGSDLNGTVEYVDDYHVRVRWDNGLVGLLYYGTMHTVANARSLLKLQKKSISKNPPPT